MKTLLVILTVTLWTTCIFGQDSEPDFLWNNSLYFELNRGDSITFQNKTIKLLEIFNHYNRLKIADDTTWLKVSRRSLPRVVSGIRIFVAENRNVNQLKVRNNINGLLKKDIMISVSSFPERLLNHENYIFPVSYNDGFIWRAEEDYHMFSFNILNDTKAVVNTGMDIDLHDARGLEKHWILAIENSTVMWIVSDIPDSNGKQTTILLRSSSEKDTYYLYEHLYSKNIEVKKGDELIKGDPLGTVWGDNSWGHLHFAVIKSDTVPGFKHRMNNALNIFPQFYDLYFNQVINYSRDYSKGVIKFAQRNEISRGVKNLLAFESYSGKGWKLGKWNVADRVEASTNGDGGNARLRKKLFSGLLDNCINPDNYYDYEINVQNGVYRIRAEVGDIGLPSWQKISFENVAAGIFELTAGEKKWTSEKVVKVEDGRLTIRIFIDEKNNRPAGISEIVFQKSF